MIDVRPADSFVNSPCCAYIFIRGAHSSIKLSFLVPPFWAFQFQMFMGRR